MAIVLSVLIVACALVAVFCRRAQVSLAAISGTGCLLAARIAIDDPLLAAAVALFTAISGSVSFLHLRRQDAEPEGRPLVLPLVLGLGLAAALLLMPIPQGSEESVAPVWPTAGMLVLIAALALLIASSLVVRIRDGRRR